MPANRVTRQKQVSLVCIIFQEIKQGRGNVTKVVTEVLDELNDTLKATRITIANNRASVKILDSISQAVNNSNSEVSFTEVSVSNFHSF